MEKQILEFRALETNDETLKIRAKVNDYSFSKMLRDKQGKPFKEIAPKEMWENAITDDVKVFINHKDYYNVGTSHRFDIQDDGLYLEIELDKEKEIGIYENVKRGILNQVSFGFNVISDRWKKVNNYFERKLEKIKLLEVSLLDCTAAYNNTAIECRSVEIPCNSPNIKRRKLGLYKLI